MHYMKRVLQNNNKIIMNMGPKHFLKTETTSMKVTPFIITYSGDLIVRHDDTGSL